MLPVVGLEALLAPEAAVDEEARLLAEEREAARRAGDFARADELRERVAGLGYAIRDTAEGAVFVPAGSRD
jgi:cysteinyl-tRNA synthetase